ncbi:MAG: DnaA/Hda family protein [Gammaproteobacteria bacterium]|nr:DnaA/Hda family protein [Gammaproteobacteria bacterium]
MNEKVGLGLTTASEASFETFFVGENELALNRVCQGERVWLFGERATGKSHILRSLEKETSCARYVAKQPPDLDEVLVSPLLLIDDIDQLCGDEENEYALFAVYEATDFAKTRWVVSAHSAPHEVSFRYRDLASRMSLFERVELLPVPESARASLLKFWANDRAFGISDEVIQFLLDRIPRTQASLWDTLQKLDRSSLLENRTLTIPFVREVMGFDKS